MLLFFVMIALSNGLCIILSRAINGRLALVRNAFYASLINHVIGFIFLSVITLFASSTFAIDVTNIPLIAFLGGVIGAFFVVINSYVLPLLGVTFTTVLAISGQVISSVVTDIIQHGLPKNIHLQLLGITLILVAIGLRYIKKADQN
ncbi:DMT family transporter [Pectobacterium polonicum]|uniref:DMT family transporter n=1 Tax=Pectobacterium polonicum TaxID=2485124 RepID=A0AAE9T0S4_9GAMM|nr:DMT family transporter [Pectobacterium polonicum]UVO07717.1 DMT family transporter [Pectobacterium polonicum]